MGPHDAPPRCVPKNIRALPSLSKVTSTLMGNPYLSSSTSRHYVHSSENTPVFPGRHSKVFTSFSGGCNNLKIKPLSWVIPPAEPHALALLLSSSFLYIYFWANKCFAFYLRTHWGISKQEGEIQRNTVLCTVEGEVIGRHFDFLYLS